MSEPIKNVPLKSVLQLIKHQATGENRKFRDLAVQLAQEIDSTNPEVSQYILAQYNLIPTFGTVDLEKDHEIRSGDFVTFKGFPNIPEDKTFQLNINDDRLKIFEVKPL